MILPVEGVTRTFFVSGEPLWRYSICCTFDQSDRSRFHPPTPIWVIFWFSVNIFSGYFELWLFSVSSHLVHVHTRPPSEFKILRPIFNYLLDMKGQYDLIHRSYHYELLVAINCTCINTAWQPCFNFSNCWINEEDLFCSNYNKLQIHKNICLFVG